MTNISLSKEKLVRFSFVSNCVLMTQRSDCGSQMGRQIGKLRLILMSFACSIEARKRDIRHVTKYLRDVNPEDLQIEARRLRSLNKSSFSLLFKYVNTNKTI